MAAIDQASPKSSFAFRELVEMNARGVLIKPRRDLMLGFLDGDAVDVVNSLADVVVAETIGAAGEREVIGGELDRRTSLAEEFGIERGRQPRHVIAWRLCRLVALTHHDPAHIFEHRRAVLVVAGGADINDAGLLAGILLKPDDLGLRGERVAGID